jgi:CDP-diacylglycerol--glycerol-3-phosphate 3-phosphatidyltransferase
MHAPKFFTLATKITLSRVLAVPIIWGLLYFDNRWTCLAALACFILASVTDAVDGYIARKSGTVTVFGKFLDPLADKILICSCLIMLVGLDRVPAWCAIIIICRELMVTGLRAVAADMGTVVAADTLGKIKTTIQVLALLPLLLHYSWFGFDPVPLGQFMLYIAVLLTVITGGRYIYTFYKEYMRALVQP